jgi:hypothetical protein
LLNNSRHTCPSGRQTKVADYQLLASNSIGQSLHSDRGSPKPQLAETSSSVELRIGFLVKTAYDSLQYGGYRTDFSCAVR